MGTGGSFGRDFRRLPLAKLAARIIYKFFLTLQTIRNTKLLLKTNHSNETSKAIISIYLSSLHRLACTSQCAVWHAAQQYSATSQAAHFLGLFLLLSSGLVWHAGLSHRLAPFCHVFAILSHLAFSSWVERERVWRHKIIEKRQ